MAAHAAVMMHKKKNPTPGGGARGHNGSDRHEAQMLRAKDLWRTAAKLKDSDFRRSNFDLSDEETRQRAASRIQLFARAHCMPYGFGKRLHRSNLYTRLQYEGTLAFGAWRLFIQVPIRVLCLNLSCLCRGSWFFCPENTRR